MIQSNRSHSPLYQRLFCFLSLAIIAFTAGCQFPTGISKTPPGTPTATPASPAISATQPAVTSAQAQVTFQVNIPVNTPNGVSVVLSILDEVTGLPYNTTSYRMNSVGANSYELQLPFAIGSVVDYRYDLDGSPRTGEYTAAGDPVRARMTVVSGEEVVQDVVSAWKDVKFSGETGQISGMVVDSQSNAPVPGVIVTAGGLRTTTASDGAYTINGLPSGTHNLVVIAPDGRIKPFQQGAKVAAGKLTEAKIPVMLTKSVNITFAVTLPKENVVGLPVRMAGNLSVLGDTFSDLAGGVSVQASREPLLTQKSDGTNSISLSMPVGTDLRYKYTLGDGFWNAELTTDGGFKVRQLIVPDHDVVIQDKIETWRSPNLAPVTFDIQAPADTPAGDIVSIQFSPFVWMEPLPMWSMGNNRWVYILYGPQHLVSQVKYRFCRNDQCDTAGASQGTAGSEPTFTPSNQPQNIQKSISAWVSWAPSDQPSEVAAADIQARGAAFSAGVEFAANYHPSWSSYIPPALRSEKALESNWVFLSPTWSVEKGPAPFF
jgi:hypothetical protein